MTPNTSKAQQRRQRLKQWLAVDKEFLKTTVREALEDVLEAEMEEALGAAKSERTAERQGYRSGYYTRSLITRIGKIELRKQPKHERGDAFAKKRLPPRAGGIPFHFDQGVILGLVLRTEKSCYESAVGA